VSRHVIGPLALFPPGSRRRVEVEGRQIAVFNVDGALHALVDTCPHRGGSLAGGTVVGRVTSRFPGCFDYEPGAKLVKCPWHGWEFELATGQSWFDPERLRVRRYRVDVESGARLAGEPVPGPYIAETVPVTVEDTYVVVELGGKS
jgi:3-phenylpropionate/trans-cinnamate dioxygenase ferredoxin subunit